MSADDHPELRAVPAAAEEDIPASDIGSAAPSELQGPSEPEAKGGTRGWLTLLLILALAAACLGYLYEGQRAQGLEAEVANLQVDLQEAHEALRAHEERMQVVRGHVDDLAARVGLLQQAVATDPAGLEATAGAETQ